MPIHLPPIRHNRRLLLHLLLLLLPRCRAIRAMSILRRLGVRGMADDRAVLVELDGAGKGAGPGWGREGATGGDVALLVVRVLF